MTAPRAKSFFEGLVASPEENVRSFLDATPEAQRIIDPTFAAPRL